MAALLELATQNDGTVYLGWGAFTIQLGNFLVIAAMVVLFILALVLPFPHGRKRP